MTHINSDKPNFSLEFSDVTTSKVVWQEKAKEEGGKKILEGRVSIGGSQYDIKIGYNEETLRKKWEIAGDSSDLEMTMKKIVEELNPNDIITLVGKTITSSGEIGGTSVIDQMGKQHSLEKIEDTKLKETATKVVAAFSKNEVSSKITKRLEQLKRPTPDIPKAPPLPKTPPPSVDLDGKPLFEEETSEYALPPLIPEDAYDEEVPLLKKTKSEKLEEPPRKETEHVIEQQLQQRQSGLVKFQSALLPESTKMPFANKMRLSLAQAQRFMGGTKDYVKALENLSELSKHGISTATAKKGPDSTTTYHDYEILASFLQKENGKRALLEDEKGKAYFREFVSNKREVLNNSEANSGDQFVEKFQEDFTIRDVESFLRAVSENYQRGLIDKLFTTDPELDLKVPEDKIINTELSVEEKKNAEKQVGHVLKEIKETEKTFLTNIRTFTEQIWAPEDGKYEEMTFFKRLQHENIITQNEYLLLQNHWEALEKTTKATLEGFKDEGGSIETKISSLITQTSPSVINDQMKNLALITKNQVEINQILTKVGQNPKGMDLIQTFKKQNNKEPSDITINPVQRGPRYLLLLSDALKKGEHLITAETKEALEHNINHLQGVMSTINELLKEKEG